MLDTIHHLQHEICLKKLTHAVQDPCKGRVSVRPSVSLSVCSVYRQQQRRAAGLLRAADTDWQLPAPRTDYRWIATGAPAAAADSVMFHTAHENITSRCDLEWRLKTGIVAFICISHQYYTQQSSSYFAERQMIKNCTSMFNRMSTEALWCASLRRLSRNRRERRPAEYTV